MKLIITIEGALEILEANGIVAVSKNGKHMTATETYTVLNELCVKELSKLTNEPTYETLEMQGIVFSEVYHSVN